MTPAELTEVYQLFQHIEQSAKGREDKYYSHFHEQMDADIKYFTRFSSWVKQAYPEVWEAWRSVEDIRNSV